MIGDFTRDSFDPEREYTRVLVQQGRPQLDADMNEQVSIFWRHIRTLTTDLIGPYAGPHDNCGFGVVTPGVISEMPIPAKEREYLRKQLKNGGDFLLSPGRYYVDGLLCEIRQQHVNYLSQLETSEKPVGPQSNKQYLVYLDVWERPVSSLEDETINEPALNGIDTSLRAKIAWRVRMAELSDKAPFGDGDSGKIKDHWATIVRDWQPRERGLLTASTSEADDAEHTHLRDHGFLGQRNQLYRVQVHQGGTVGGAGEPPTFKVSRENGSVMFRISSISGEIATLEAMGNDSRFGLKAGDWVEICDGTGATLLYEQKAPPLLQIAKADAGRRQVTLKGTPAAYDDKKRLVLRRWDHREGDSKKGGLDLSYGAIKIKEADAKGAGIWMPLENGLRIQFQKSTTAGTANTYRTGDYWLIPARVAGEGVLWPRDDKGKPAAIAPHGVEHHYAPLAVVALDKSSVLEIQGDCRPKFKIPVAFGFA